jgi:type II secretory pathway pseudopilin PulG
MQQRMMRRERGDTLIEVMLSIAVMGLVVIGCNALMNKANNDLAAAMERTEVRADINAQTEMLAYLRDAYLSDPLSTTGASGVWNNITKTSGGKLHSSYTDVTTADEQCRRDGQSFFLQPNSTGIALKDNTFISNADASRAKPGQGLWINAVKSPDGVKVPYVDFYVQSCWSAIGGGAQQRSSTVVRLYYEN